MVETETKFKKLKNFNLTMGILHLFQGILMVVLSNDFALPVTRSYLAAEYPTGTTGGMPALITVSETLFEVWIGPLVALFLFISAAAHILISTVLYKKYIAGLMNHQNRYRWYEYAISSSLMIVVISMLVGISDIGTLMLAFFLNMMMILFGLLMETMNEGRRKLDWSPFWFGCIAGFIPWVVIFVWLFGAGGSGGGPPDFVYWIFLSMAIFFNSFAVNMWLQYKKKGKWADYLYGERMYVILSLVAKSLLAWQVFAGTLRPA
nr:Heliorhodopsin [uncultured Thermoplasmata archaeon]